MDCVQGGAVPDLSSLVITPYDRCPSGTVLLDNCCSPSTSLYVSLDLTLLFPLPHLACLFTSLCLFLDLTLPFYLSHFPFTSLYLSLCLALPFSLPYLPFSSLHFACLYSLCLSLYLSLPVSLPHFTCSFT